MDCRATSTISHFVLPASVTTAPKEEPAPAAEKKSGDELDVNAVFAKLKQLGGKSE